jgi:hypothetical protein
MFSDTSVTGEGDVALSQGRAKLTWKRRCEKMGIQCLAKSSKSLRKPRQIRPLNR